MSAMRRLMFTLLTAFVGLGSMSGGLLITAAPAAAAPLFVVASFKSDACSGLSQLDSSQSCGSGSQGTINKVIHTVIRVLSVVLGAVSIIMIIVSGFRYITSGGDTGAVSSAKRTLIYALVGLVIAVLAEFLAHFVINSAAKATK